MVVDWGPAYGHLQRTRAYLEALPSGLRSYPECLSKVSIWRNILRWTDTARLVGGLPPELRALFALSMPDSAWFPAVHIFVGHLLLRDCLFASDEAICEHFRFVNRKLLSGRLYRVLFMVSSPEMLVYASDRRFGQLFRGIAFAVRWIGRGQLEVTLTYPPYLLPPLVCRLYLVAFEVAVELAGAQKVRGEQLEENGSSIRYALRWQVDSP